MIKCQKRKSDSSSYKAYDGARVTSLCVRYHGYMHILLSESGRLTIGSSLTGSGRITELLLFWKPLNGIISSPLQTNGNYLKMTQRFKVDLSISLLILRHL